MGLIEELKRRNVFRVGIAYVVAAWVLLQLADLVLDNIGAPSWVMQAFMLALVIGFPLVLIFAWAFEMTPEGIKREKDVDRNQSITPQTGRKLDRIIMAFLVIAVAVLLFDRFREPAPATEPAAKETATAETTAVAAPKPASEPATDDKSVAVLPLANLSTNADDAFFAQGMQDELLTQLSRISSLRVISRTSVMGYAGTTKRMSEIGQELGVANILEGGVQRAGNRVRINVQLIRAATDDHLWADTYDRELTADNLFDIQSDITRSIAEALQAVLTGQEQAKLEEKPTENVEAYSHYLHAKAMSQSYGRSLPQIDDTIADYQAAVELDPNFTQAWAALATDWMERWWNGDKLGDERDRAQAALEHARQLAPQAPETLTAEGYYHYWGYLDYAEAIDAFDQALGAAPNHLLALRGKAYVLRRLGKLDEAVATLQRIVSLDPRNAQLPADLAYTLLHAGRYAEAGQALQQAYGVGPFNEWNRNVLAGYEQIRGNLEAALKALGPVRANTSGFLLASRAPILIALRKFDETASILPQLRDQASYELPAWLIEGALLEARGDAEALASYVRRLQDFVDGLATQQPDSDATVTLEVALQGHRHDQAALRKAVERYHAVLKPDAMRIVEDQTPLLAYAYAGDADSVLDYLQQLVDQLGPWELYDVAVQPAFDRFRDLPRFKALMQQYQEWVAGLPPAVELE